MPRFIPPVIILIVSLVTHFLFFGHPHQVVFDEVHVLNYLSNYWHHTYFFDVHPPLAKLLLAGFGYIIGAQNEIIDWTKIGNDISPTVVYLRLIPTLAGTFLPLIVYWICRRINIKVIASTLAALLICFENSLLVQSRFLTVDIIMILFGFFSIATYFEYKHQINNPRLAYSLLALSTISTAAAASIKWTGLSFLLLIIIIEIHKNYNQGKILKKKILLFASNYLSVLCIIYISIFAIHFYLLPQPGPGNVYMAADFQSQNFWQKTTDLNIRMFDRSASLTDPHKYSSKWYTWPFMIRSMFYWQSENSYIYLLGNPFLYWLGLAAILSLIIYRKNDKAVFFILIGYMVNILPFIFIGRVMFIYHYETALIISIMAIAYIVDTTHIEKKKLVAASFFGLALLGFLYWSPLSYGTDISKDSLSQKMWLSTWR